MTKRTRLISLLLAVVLLVSAIPFSVFAAGDVMYGVAWITGNKLRLRSAANTDSETLDNAPKGDVAVVIEKEGKWYRVIYNGQEGYMSGDYLDVEKRENVELGYGKVTANKVNIRKGPGTSYKAVLSANKGDKAYIIGINNGWYKIIIDSKIGYIRSDYLELTEIPYENAASEKSPIFFENGKSTGVKVKASALKDTGKVETEKEETKPAEKEENKVESSAPIGEKIVAKAKQYLGYPYVWNSESPEDGFDCSGFVYYIYNTMGIKVPRTQDKMYAQGTPIEKEDLIPGDIVFFQNTYKAGISHCGIYVGDGIFIHASSSNDTVRYSELDSKYYTAHYYGAVRMK